MKFMEINHMVGNTPPIKEARFLGKADYKTKNIGVVELCDFGFGNR